MEELRKDEDGRRRLHKEKERLDKRVAEATEPQDEERVGQREGGEVPLRGQNNSDNLVQKGGEEEQLIEKEELPESIDESMEVDEHVKKLVEDKIAQIEVETELITAIREAAGKPDVSEVYSPPRVTATAARMGLRPGRPWT